LAGTYEVVSLFFELVRVSGMTRIALPKTKLTTSARIDPKSVFTARPAAPAGTKTLAERKQDHFFPGGAPGSSGPRDSTWVDGGKKPGKKPLLTGSTPVKGDSFAADRINRPHQGGDVIGPRNEQVSTTFRVDAENDAPTVVDPGAGKSRETLVKENQAQAREIDRLRLELLIERAKNKTPNPMGDDPASGPVTQQEVTTQRKGIKRPHTDGDDGRGDTQQASGNGPMRETTGQDDRPARVQNTGPLNMDAVLKIDQLVNPQRH
jgi:hypothetical protein